MLRNRSSRRALAAFGGVLILAGAGTTGTAPAATFGATLSGDHVVGGGDSDGWGRARVRVDDFLETVCVALEVRSVGRVTGAHIHRGADGVNGPPVVRLDRPDGEDQDEDDCDTIGDALADDIQANPTDFYVSITTDEHPEGALRGQLLPNAD